MESQSSADLFLAATTRRELAAALKTKYHVLVYNLHVVPEHDRYTNFIISKKGGGEREIVAPISGLKLIQRKLASLLLEIYPDKKCVFGFLKGKNIKLNAKRHTGKRIVINIDLKDFFPSINFGRVLGLFKSAPFNFNHEVAVSLAQICCSQNILPQGAPSSPIVSNFICRRLDNALLRFARKNKLVYTRYADDISFSTNLKEIPSEFGYLEDDKLILSEELRNIITGNGFEINENKTRYAFSNNRQKVTGLTVNEFPNVDRKYVRNIRAMVHAWEKYGIENAAIEYFEKYKKTELPDDYINIFREVVIGKINFLKYIKHNDKEGDSPLYQKFTNQVKRLAPRAKLAAFRRYVESTTDPIIMGEGVTDTIHLKAALEYFKAQGRFVDLNLVFPKEREAVEKNNIKLLNYCLSFQYINIPYPREVICVFDRDAKEINRSHLKEMMSWGNNVYSILTPKPSHRDFDEVCIEFYFSDEILKLKDENGRRIYTSDEFDKTTGKHLVEPDIYFKKIPYLQSKYPRIINDNVFKINADGSKTSMALSKKSFAENCATKVGNFRSVTYEYFESIFVLLSAIIKKEAKS